MKRMWVVYVLCLIWVGLSACGENKDGGKNNIVPIESVKMGDDMINDDSSQGNSTQTGKGSMESGTDVSVEPSASDTPAMGETDPDVDLDSYEGVYNDYDNNESNLEISRNEDGSYSIRIGIFRLISLEDGVGQDTGDGIHFSSNDTGLEGTITLEGDVATVTFEGDFPYSDIKSYKYYKAGN